ncbi:pseudouridine synthase [Coralliovum pocilloporae]|uniref:pseudouridine synthase n=1 Tax=Coralliovum pocilloporae TaxID=3066369 RepID=UPI0033077F14
MTTPAHTLVHYAPPLDPWLDVLHQDEHILVLSKQSGLLSVPGKGEHLADCLEARAQEAYPEARTVHRLDRDTSGVVIMAMTKDAHRHLGLQFERRKTEKTYIANVYGQVRDDVGRISQPLICDWPNRPRQMIDHERGREAITFWQVIERGETSTRMCLKPETGRSHQLRVHMLHLGHPILGDNFYGSEQSRDAAPRLMLHAESLTVHHPSDGERMTFHSPCPF